MADKQRQRQVAQSIRKVAGDFFSAEPPAGTLATVTDIEMSPDLNYADIYISVLPAEKREVAMRKAKEALPGLRRKVGNTLKLRKVPEIRLSYDDRSEARNRVEKILNDTDEKEAEE